MNRSDIFKKVATHLLAQNKTSLLEGNNYQCAYRGTKGLQCAVGCLISDEAYSPGLEGKSVLDQEVTVALKRSGIDLDWELGRMLTELQYTHDCKDPATWSVELQVIARGYGVDWSPDA